MDELTRTRVAARERAAAERFEKYFHRCTIEVLVVADSFLYFNDEDFGLSDFLSIMQASPARVRFNITKAHRGNPSAERLAGATPNFKFTDEGLARFDQVWLFAAETDGSLEPSEVLALTLFMQDGKGVFATGDHENLGVAMCGEIPRVRSMRKWYWPEPGPLGEPRAPDGSTARRHDTNRPGRNGTFSFDDQSDSIPQQTIPKVYVRRISSSLSEKYPHPILCGPHGIINVLPDHPHEGDCIVPAVVDRQLEVGPEDAKVTITEYPVDALGRRVLPEVISVSEMLPGAASDKPPIPGGRFGAIGAYDGHRVNLGRVVVDATWHHFININLTGDAGNPDAEKAVGFLHAQSLPVGSAERLRIERDYAQIRAYFHNIGTWLAPESKQACLNRWALRWVAKSYPLLEELATLRDKKLDPEDYVRIGMSGYAALQRFTRPCGALKIMVEIFRPIRERWPFPIDPWDPPGPGPGPDPGPFGIDARGLELANLGAVLVEMHRLDGTEEKRVEEDALVKAMDAGQQRGAKVVQQGLSQLSNVLEKVFKTDKSAY